MSPSHFCPAVLLNVTSGSDTPPHDRTCLHGVDVFVWRQMGGGHTMASWQSEEFASGGRHQVLFIPWHAIRKLKVILCRLGESTLSRRRITCHWKEKKHFDRCVIVVPPRAYFMLTRIALALKMYCVSCCRWQIHFTYRASLCHPSASFYVEA